MQVHVHNLSTKTAKPAFLMINFAGGFKAHVKAWLEKIRPTHQRQITATNRKMRAWRNHCFPEPFSEAKKEREEAKDREVRLNTQQRELRNEVSDLKGEIELLKERCISALTENEMLKSLDRRTTSIMHDVKKLSSESTTSSSVHCDRILQVFFFIVFVYARAKIICYRSFNFDLRKKLCFVKANQVG